MKIIITTKIAEALVAADYVTSIAELQENEAVEIVDDFPERRYFVLQNIIDELKLENCILEKEPSWAKFNKGNFSKRQRRKHNP